MDKLLSSQTLLYQEIIKLINSDPLSKEIDEKWAGFDKNNGLLMKFPELANHQYVTENVFADLKNRINEARTKKQTKAMDVGSTSQAANPLCDFSNELDVFLNLEVLPALHNGDTIFLKKIMNRLISKSEKLTSIVDLADSSLKSTGFYEEIKNKIADAKVDVEEKIIKNSAKTKEEDYPLPKTEILKFNGEQNNWIVFSELFKEIVHNRSELSIARKFQYLKMSLGGEALKAVHHLMDGSSENYNYAWELLQNRYENNRKTFAENIECLLALPKLREEEKELKHFINTVNESVHIIKKKGDCGEGAGTIIAQLIMRKFERSTVHQYDQLVTDPKEVQQLYSVMDFLERLYATVCATSSSSKLSSSTAALASSKPSSSTPSSSFVSAKSNENFKCSCCKIMGHSLLACRKFKALDIAKRIEFVKSNKVCNRCLLHDSGKSCSKDWVCGICKKPHHTLIHTETKKVSANMTHNAALQNSALFATAMVRIKNREGHAIDLRAMIDCASEQTVISEETAQLLRLSRIRETTELGGMTTRMTDESTTRMDIEILSTLHKSFKAEVEVLVVPNLYKTLPKEPMVNMRKGWGNIQLADPNFDKPGRVDLVIGLDLYPQIITNGVKKNNNMLAQNTELGWIICGGTYKTTKSVLSAVTTINVSELNKFWEFDEPDNENVSEYNACEEHFAKTSKVEKDGRYVVEIPFKEDNTLGSSKKQAMARLLSLERQFERKPQLKDDYIHFINEYSNLGHMKKVKSSSDGYFLPHQAVIRESSLTTKLRVVFDASAKTTNGRSLNDVMMVGPKQQKDIFDILLKWRTWKYVVSADIEKMYRQIWVAEDQQKYQQILWRDCSTKRIQQYKLTTVTYGTAAAPFLATKVLSDIAERAKTTNSEVSSIIKDDFYMDDLLTGANRIDECRRIQTEVSKELKKYGFSLRKWVSNSNQIINNIDSIEKNMIIQIEENETVKTLGLHWDPIRDTFFFKINIGQKEFTKRKVLATLARIFDPLGWLSPVIVTGKLFIQKLWSSSLSWDVPLSEEFKDEWQQYILSLQQLETFKIPRWVYTTTNDMAQLHGFSDASDSAYAAAVYIKVGDKVTLLTSKTKVNPIKNRKTIPKLELCGAHLLAKLLAKVVTTLNWRGSIFGWCDSQITLAWINNNKSKEKFVRTRVADIQKHPNIAWRYVKSGDNPADAASRGIGVNKFINNSLWWNGPSWLSLEATEWPVVNVPKESLIIAATFVNTNVINELAEKYSSFNKLERVLAYALRFISKLKNKNSNLPSYLTSDELNQARQLIIKNKQAKDFGSEINNLKNGKGLDIKNKILSLNPFLDKDGILRVGGRLQNSSLIYSEKHPIILKNSHLAYLIVSQTHKATLHGGITLMKVNIRRSYWIIGLRNMLKSYVRKCVTCIRYRQEAVTQIMGNLPESRVSAIYPFENTGVDYAGPINIKCSKGRGRKTYKGYVAVFVCMATRCIHLELVSDLTSEAFMAALKRFFARRGKSSNIYSDNGTNFVGATKILNDDLTKALKNNNKLAPTLEADGVRWHFIPPAAPHFGGIWEAGVKSFKFHLKRVIGDTILTYEEMSTLLNQIEAVLNSRPLYSTGDDIADIDVLTPGHFLIGRPMLSSPESMTEDRLGSLDRWKLIQKMQRDFWKRWKEEYLNSLQQRNKWKQQTENLKKDQVVLIRNENAPPAKWPMGVVVNTNAGKDGKVRVIEIKTKGGLIERPITKVCPLKSEDSNLQNNIPTQREEQRPTRPNTRQSRSNTSLVMMPLLNLCMVLTSTALNSTAVKEMKNNTAIYLDPINQINIASSSWDLVVYYEMKPYFNVLNEATQLIEKAKLICPRLQTFEEQCWTVLGNIQYQVDKVNANNMLLLNKNTRVKRGSPLNFIGSSYHIIFGLMDDDDRQAFESNMKNLLANQNDLKLLAKKQTSVVDSTVNLLKRTTDEVSSHFRSMKANIENISTTMNEHYYVYRESIRFFMVTKQIHDLVDECNEVQKEAIDLLLNVNHGKVHPALISPQHLQAEIVKIRDVLPDKYVLPGRHTGTELKEIWHLLTGTGIFVGSQLIIDLKIPLFSRQASQFYRIIPVPFKQNGHVLIAKIKAPYIVYNYDLDSYHYLSQAILNDCKKTLTNQIVCEENFPWIAATANVCELSPIKPHSKLNCSYDYVDEMPFWIELRSKGNWLYKIFKNTSAHVKCSNSQQFIIQLPQQGIFTLKEECTARIDEITLVATHSLRSARKYGFENFLTKDVNLDDSGIAKPIGNVVINHGKEIDDLKKHIADLKKEDVHLRGLTFHHLSGHTALGISTVIMIAFIVYVIYQITLRRRLLAIQFNSPRQNVQN